MTETKTENGQRERNDTITTLTVMIKNNLQRMQLKLEDETICHSKYAKENDQRNCIKEVK